MHPITTVSISGLALSFSDDFGLFPENDPFSGTHHDDQDEDMCFSVSVDPDTIPPEYVLFQDGRLVWFRHKAGVGAAIYTSDGLLYAALRETNCFKEIRISLSSKKNAASALKTLSEIAFRNRLLYHGGLVFHASAVSVGKNGIAFTAPSGGGKSTQANLWKAAMNAEILNADRPAVIPCSSGTYIFGTPWSGSANESRNKKALLKAIVCVQKGGRTRLRSLSSTEALPLLLPRVFLPYFDETLMRRALSNLETIIGSVPVYVLEGLPDMEAMSLVRDAVL